MCHRLAPLLALLVWPAAAPAAAIDRGAVDELAERARKFWRVPGLAVAVIRGDEVYLHGYGVRSVEDGGLVTPHTLFPVASCTKSFTTSAMALLVDEGKMGWDDPPRKHLPSFRLSDPLADANVTLRDLVTHRTGLRDHYLLWYRSPWPPEEVVRRAGRLPLDRPFRTTFQYQSTMFTAAGLAAAAASGMKWDQLVRRRLLDPLGMKETYFTTSEIADVVDRAVPHRPDDEGRPRPTEPYPMEVPDPAGSIQSSAADLSRWLRFHLDNKLVDGKPLVSAKNLDETHTPQIVLRMDPIDYLEFPGTHQMSYGMGWVIQDFYGHRVLQHAGLIDGFRCHFTLVPRERIGLVLLCNLHHTRLNLALSNGLLGLLLGLPRKDWNALVADAERKDQEESAKKEREQEDRRRRDTHPSREPAGYTGTYEHPAYGSVRVSLEDGKLVWSWNRFRAALEHYQYDTFRLPVAVMGEPRVVFAPDADGTVTRMKVLGNMGAEFRRSR